MKKFLLLVSTAALILTGCSNGGNDQTTNFRFFNAVPDVDSVDFAVDFEPYFTGTGYLEGSGYFDIDSGQHSIQATVTNSFTALADSRTTLSDEQDYTLLVFGLSTDSSSLLLRDDNDPAGDGFSKLRLINAAQASRNVDVYILAPTADINSAAPTDESLTYRQVTRYLASQSGPYVVTVTPRNSKEILAQTSVQNFESNGVYSVIVADSSGGTIPPRIVVLKDR